MTGTRSEIVRAEAKAAAARLQVRDTLARLKSRLDPRVRAAEMWDDTRRQVDEKVGTARAKGEVLADEAVEFAYEQPGLIAGVAGLGALFLLRRPIVRLVARLRRPRRAKWDIPTVEVRRISPAGTAVGQKGERS